MPRPHNRQDKTRLSCLVLSSWRCEQNWQQVKTVFSSPHCISRLDKTFSKFSVADSLDLSPILYTPPTRTRQDKTVLSCPQWLNYSTKGRWFLFPVETATWLEICIRVYQLLETLRVHTHNISLFKVPYHKSVKQKNDLVPWSLPTVHLIYSSSVENWHWIHRTVRIPCLTVEDPNKKVPDLYFKVVDPKL